VKRATGGTEAAAPPDGARALLLELTTAAGAGEATAAAFYARASERLRGAFGAEQHFARALGNDRFLPLLLAGEVRLAAVERIGDSARGTLVATGSAAAGEPPATFILAVAVARHGPHAGEWRLSGVAREGVDL